MKPDDTAVDFGAQAMVCLGQVRHRRLRPAAHAFAYPGYCLLLPMRSLAASGRWPLAHNRRAWLSFHDSDHGEGGSDALAWVEDLLAREGVQGVEGEIWLQTFARQAGVGFKPVSFWYGHAADGRLQVVLAEVNNTFGERHVYLLHGPELAWGATVKASKVFHVSPFCRAAGEYRFRFMRTATHLVARVELHDDAGTLLVTSQAGRLQTANAASLRAAQWHAPLQSLGILARIHWQALRLWAKRVPFFHKPAAPAQLVTR